jgi:hypothetical protein
LGKWGIRNGHGDTYEETLDEADAQTAKRRAEVVVIDSDSGDDGAGGSRAGGSRGAAASAARVGTAARSDSESDVSNNAATTGKTARPLGVVGHWESMATLADPGHLLPMLRPRRAGLSSCLPRRLYANNGTGIL